MGIHRHPDGRMTPDEFEETVNNWETVKNLTDFSSLFGAGTRAGEAAAGGNLVKGSLGSALKDTYSKGLERTRNLEEALENSRQRTSRRRRRRDPLALDLDGDGIETVALNGFTGPMFDHDGDGAREATGWFAADDGLLVLDRNGNGKIDNGSELFGDNTILANGETAAHGYAALADLDNNEDGIIDDSDARYADLKVWRDLNQDGVSQSDELFSLAEVGVATIETSFLETNIEQNGNEIIATGQYTKTDGSTGETADANLATSNFFTSIISSEEIPEAIMILPNAQGTGQVANLHDAAYQSSDVAVYLEFFSNTASREEQIDLLDGLLALWTQTSSMPSMAEQALEEHYLVNFSFGSLGNNAADINQVVSELEPEATLSVIYDAYTSDQSTQYQEWIQKLAIIEKFTGEHIYDYASLVKPSKTITISIENGGSPIEEDFGVMNVTFDQGQLNALQEAYDIIWNSVYESLCYQTRLQQYFDEAIIQVDEEGLTFTFGEMEIKFNNNFNSDPLNTAVDLIEFNRYHGDSLKELGWNPMSFSANILLKVSLCKA